MESTTCLSFTPRVKLTNGQTQPKTALTQTHTAPPHRLGLVCLAASLLASWLDTHTDSHTDSNLTQKCFPVILPCKHFQENKKITVSHTKADAKLQQHLAKRTSESVTSLLLKRKKKK